MAGGTGTALWWLPSVSRKAGDQGRLFLTSEMLPLLVKKVFVIIPSSEVQHLPSTSPNPYQREASTVPRNEMKMVLAFRAIPRGGRAQVCRVCPPSASPLRACISPCSPPHAAACCTEHRCRHRLPPPGCFQKRVLNIHLLIFKRIF